MTPLVWVLICTSTDCELCRLITHFLDSKIKRVVFTQVRKSDGERDHLLSPPQIKQIAGRAGRYGLHNDDAGGTVTTLHEGDLPVLQKALAYPPATIHYARLRPDRVVQTQMRGVLPTTASFSTLSEVMQYVSKLDPCYEPETAVQTAIAAAEIDRIVKSTELTRDELWCLQEAPVSWRNLLAVKCFLGFIKQFRQDVHVDVRRAIDDVGLLDKLNNVLRLAGQEEGTASIADIKSASLSLYDLEVLHKILCAYMWLSWRLPVGFQDRDVARELKLSTEQAIWWLIHELSKMRERGLNLGQMDFRPTGNLNRRSTGKTGFGFGSGTRDRRDSRNSHGLEDGLGRPQRQRAPPFDFSFKSNDRKTTRSRSS